MKTRTLIALGGAALLLCSCIPSVNPFYTAKDLVFDPRLVGAWQVPGGQDQPEFWRFKRATDHAYKLTVTDSHGKQGQFAAHLFQLAHRERFLDLIPRDCQYATNQNDLVDAAMFPGHLLFRVAMLGPELKLAACDFDWLQKYLEKHPAALAHHQEEVGMLLTANTDDLQRFVLQHLGAGELFGQPVTLVPQTNRVSRANRPAAP
jgi:hypothetical protein